MAVSLLTTVILLPGCNAGLIAAAAAGGAKAWSETASKDADFNRKLTLEKQQLENNRETNRLNNEHRAKLGLSQALSSGESIDCYALQGALVIAHDGTFLGKLTSEYNSDSVLNEYGEYGSDYSNTSIWNDYSEYGGQISALSPFNEFATPPFIIKEGRAVGKLTVNPLKNGSVNPYLIKSCNF